MNSVMTQPLQLLFIDTDVQDAQLLISGLEAEVQVFVLDDKRDGVDQISETLAYLYRSEFFAEYELKAIHIVAHGVPGCIYLGNGELSLSTIDRYTNSLKNWCKGGTAIQLYACNLAAGDAGEELITKLHHATGAVIYASNSKVGHASVGGSWTLDRYTTEGVQNIFDQSVLEFRQNQGGRSG